MNFYIRDAVGEDAEGICLLNRFELGYDFPLEAVREKLDALTSGGKDKILVAVAEGKVVGYIHASDYDTLYMPHLKNIMGIAVSRDYRRAGIGKALLSAAEEWAKDTNAKGIRLVSGESRPEAHIFYQKCEYISAKNQKNFKKMF